MWWKKTRANDGRVYGYMDKHNHFHSTKQKRDESNYRIDHEEIYREIQNQFDDIVHAIQLNKIDICRWEDFLYAMKDINFSKSFVSLLLKYQNYKIKYEE